MRSNGHYSNGLPVGGFLRRVPFWLGAVIVSFVPTKILSTIEYLLVPSQGIGSLILDEALVLSLIMLYFLYAMRDIATRMDRRGQYTNGMSPENTTLRVRRTPIRAPTLLFVWTTF